MTLCAFCQHLQLKYLQTKQHWLIYDHCFPDLWVNTVFLQQKSASSPSHFIRNQQQCICCCMCYWQLHGWDIWKLCWLNQSLPLSLKPSCYIILLSPKDLKWTKQSKSTLWRTYSSLRSRIFHQHWSPLYTFLRKWVNYYHSVCLTCILNHYFHELTTFSVSIPQLRISRYDRKPLSSVDLTYSAKIVVTQRTSLMDAEPTTLTLSVPEDGNVNIEFKLQDQVVMVFIWVSVLTNSIWNVASVRQFCKMSSFSTVGLHTCLLRKWPQIL